MTEMSPKRHCCKLECSNPAEFAIFGNSGWPEDHTDACADHVGHLLDTPLHVPQDNSSWHVTFLGEED